MSIIISRGGKNAKRVERSVIDREDYLQQYIYDNPESLPLHELKDDINILIVSREFQTHSGPIDALGIDRDGDVYIIETKLYKNADKRRVIAQVLDYGASLWINQSSEFISRLEESSLRNFNIGFSSKVQEFFGFEDNEVVDYINLLEQNVNSGNFKFVVLMDRIESRLKELISFVNTNSNFDVLGVELDFYQDKDVEIIIPNLYGAERKKEVVSLAGKSSTRKKWDENLFFEVAEQTIGADKTELIREIYDWSRKNADGIKWGTGISTGSFNVKFANVSQRSVYTFWTDGSLSLNFKWLSDSDESINQAKALGDELKNIAELEIPEDYINQYVSIPFDKWKNVLPDFIQTVEMILRK